MEKLEKYLESLIFVAEQPVKLTELKYVLDNNLNSNFDLTELEIIIDKLQKKYESDDFSFEIVKISDGYTFLTKQSYHSIIEDYLKSMTKKKLSRASLETLAIIAYKQPLTKPEIEQIRGVNCDYSIQKLLEKNLIAISGRDQGPGRPLIYSTSEKFMDYFGLQSMKDLPGIKDFEQIENTIGKNEEE